MTPADRDWLLRVSRAQHAVLQAATMEARFLAGRARLALSPPGTWQRSPQRGLVHAARKES